MTPQSRYLTLVDPVRNHNMFYSITIEPNSSQMKCEFGRVGQNKQVIYKPLSSYDSIIRQKLNAGYVDMTDSFKKVIAGTLDTSVDSIKDIGAKDLITKFLQFSNQQIKQSYTIDKSSVNMTAIQKVEDLIKQLEDLYNKYKAKSIYQNDEKGFVNAFKDIQLKIFKTVPRRLRNVYYACLQRYDEDEIDRILTKEKELIDMLKTNIQMSTPQAASAANASGTSSPVKDYLTNLGLELHQVTDQAKIDEIKGMMGSEYAKYYNRLFIAVNHETQSKFESFMKAHPNCKPTLFFHGSSNKNWLSILKNGLKIQFNGNVAHGTMLGAGIYAAPFSGKSINYTSLRNLPHNYWGSNDSEYGYMALFAFAIDVNNQYDYYRSKSECRAVIEKLQRKDAYDQLQRIKPGATHVFGHKEQARNGTGYQMLKDDEIAIYREDQVTIRYIIECKN